MREVERHIKKSKFLSWVLRHDPHKIGLSLDPEGWADISDLIDCAENNGVRLDITTLHEIVETDTKGRYEISADLRRIRATYGHSQSVALNLEPGEPPNILYHGTATRFVDSIMKYGLKPRKRQYVHLSVDAGTAMAVASRHGKAVLLQIDARSMHKNGMDFYHSAKEIWLTRDVPARYIKINHNRKTSQSLR